jgi:hypothetical protein
MKITINQGWQQTADVAGNGGLSKGGEGRGARQQMVGWGGCATKAILMMKTVGQPSNDDD